MINLYERKYPKGKRPRRPKSDDATLRAIGDYFEYEFPEYRTRNILVDRRIAHQYNAAGVFRYKLATYIQVQENGQWVDKFTVQNTENGISFAVVTLRYFEGAEGE